MIVSGAGVGGGSLVYANTLYEPLAAVLRRPAVARTSPTGESELAPFYDQAKRMLGVVENPLRTPADDVMEKVATDMGVGDTFHPTPVGVFFGAPARRRGSASPTPTSAAPVPSATTCIGCGECMTGCRHNAKNTLVKNYLYLAEQNGAQVLPLTTVTRVSPRTGGGYDVRVRFTKAKAAPSLGDPDADRRAGGVLRLLARHPAAAAPDARRGPPAARLAAARLPLAHELRVDPRRDRAGHEGRLQPGRRDHLELPPRRAHAHRAGAATARAATRCR